jgi:o-succinylbenzoate synthase
MSFPRQFRIFEEKFNHPILTGHGLWDTRRSIILREEKEDGIVAYGEMAPTPGFAEREFDRYLHEAAEWVRGEVSENSPLFLSACSCLSCGIWEKEGAFGKKPLFTAGLMIEGESAKRGFETVKRKIGLRPVRHEIVDVLSWIAGLPDLQRIRLDANEALDLESLQEWVDALEGESKLEFIEQPLPRWQLDEMIQVSTQTSICFALDESVLSFGGPDALKEKGWSGFYVLKPLLMKDWEETIRFIRSEPDKSLVSTVFESPFGYEAICRIAGLSNLVPGVDRSPFNGNAKEFPEHHEFPLLPHSVGTARLEELWNTL